jgi:hypothetical protein
MAGYGIMRMAKIGGASMSGVGNIAAHHERKQGYTAKSNPDIDPGRTGQNYALVDSRDQGRITDRIEARISAGLAPNRDGSARKVREDAVKVVDALFAFSPGSVAPEGHKAYFEGCLEWFEGKLGGRANIVSAVVHMDEKTPHMHVLAVPLMDGRLNVGKIMDGRNKLRELQDSFHREVSGKWGLLRGEKAEITKRKHLDTVDYKRVAEKQAKKEYEEARKKYDGELETLKKEVEKMHSIKTSREAIDTSREMREWIENVVRPGMTAKGWNKDKVEMPKDVANEIINELDHRLSWEVDLVQDYEALERKYEALKKTEQELIRARETLGALQKKHDNTLENFNNFAKWTGKTWDDYELYRKDEQARHEREKAAQKQQPQMPYSGRSLLD